MTNDIIRIFITGYTFNIFIALLFGILLGLFFRKNIFNNKLLKKITVVYLNFFDNIINRVGLTLIIFWVFLTIIYPIILEKSIFWLPMVSSISAAWIFYILTHWIPQYNKKQKQLKVLNDYFNGFSMTLTNLLNMMIKNKSKLINSEDLLDLPKICTLKKSDYNYSFNKKVIETQHSTKGNKIEISTNVKTEYDPKRVINGLRSIIISDLDFMSSEFKEILSFDEIHSLYNIKSCILALGRTINIETFFEELLICLDEFSKITNLKLDGKDKNGYIHKRIFMSYQKNDFYL